SIASQSAIRNPQSAISSDNLSPAPAHTSIIEKIVERIVERPLRRRLPDTRNALTHKFDVGGHEGYITVGLYEDGSPGEVFITMAKEGSTIGGLMDCFGTAVSMSLQYGVPLEVYVSKFSHTRFEPMGHTKNPDIRIAKSIVDYIFRWLGIQFLPGYREASTGMAPEPAPTPAAAAEETSEAERSPVAKKAGGLATSNGKHTNGAAPAAANGQAKAKPSLLERAGVAPKFEFKPGQTTRGEQFASFQVDAPVCDNCGAITVRAGNCYLCHNCGNSMGCS
ncbi:MAG TPA: vitamin B12-dependent ribonucleotide reductase, partial [Pirellulales bacterium]|nr:vitamin B12-dependent ribonucleotide reductase [Pirellulales bacterium]